MSNKQSQENPNITLEMGNKQSQHQEMESHSFLGDVLLSLGAYEMAIEYHEKSLNIALESGNKIGEGNTYYNLGRCYSHLRKNQKAIEYYKKGLNIAKETGNKTLEGEIYRHIGIAYQLWNKYQEAIEHYEKGLIIAKEEANKKEEASTYCGLGGIYNSLGKYSEAMEYKEKSLKLALEIGDKSLEGTIYFGQGKVYLSLSNYQEALKCYEKSLNISLEMNEKNNEASSYEGIGEVYKFKGKYKEAIESYKKSLNIVLDIGDKTREGELYTSLGFMYILLGKYQDAMEYCKKGLNIAIEEDDKKQEGITYQVLGNIYASVGKYRESIEYLEKSLKIALEVGYKNGEIVSYSNLGDVYLKLGKQREAVINYKKSLDIALEIGNKYNELLGYKKLGDFFFSLGMYQAAIEYHEMSLNIATESFDRNGEASSYIILGYVHCSLGKYQEALEYGEKSLRIAKEIGSKVTEAQANYLFGKSYWSLNTTVNSTDNNESLKNNQDLSKRYLKESVRCFDDLYEHSYKQDDSKISIVDTFIEAYKLLTTVLIETNQTEEALLVCDRGRARALGDILISKYAIDKKHALRSTTREYPDVTKMLSKNNFCILFFAAGMKGLDTWVITSQKPLFFMKNKIEGLKLINDLIDKMNIMQTLKCENRSLESLRNVNQDDDPDGKPGLQAIPGGSKRTPDEETQNTSQQEMDQSLETLFNLLVTPVLQNLEQEEIVIIPSGPLYMVPFAALRDPKTGHFLSETKRIRLAPSIRTLQTLQECPEESHCKRGALVVGDPVVGEVIFQGEKIMFPPLPKAKHEAEIIGAILNTEPLIEYQATKENVKARLRKGVAIIHIAAHGSSENGNIALAPPARTEGGSTPKEEDYMLTMQEVQEIGIKAQLVFLSCCHSGRGEIRSEGVVGMSRAFLAAGARAVVASLWDIDDDAARTFMVSFYTYLKMGDSASTSLQKAMKEIREDEIKCYSEPKYWAPFFLIGDDVTIKIH